MVIDRLEVPVCAKEGGRASGSKRRQKRGNFRKVKRERKKGFNAGPLEDTRKKKRKQNALVLLEQLAFGVRPRVRLGRLPRGGGGGRRRRRSSCSCRRTRAVSSSLLLRSGDQRSQQIDHLIRVLDALEHDDPRSRRQGQAEHGLALCALESARQRPVGKVERRRRVGVLREPRASHPGDGERAREEVLCGRLQGGRLGEEREVFVGRGHNERRRRKKKKEGGGGVVE